VPLVSVLVDDWSRRDVELRSKLLFNSAREHVAVRLAENQGPSLVPFFERLTEDERILALGYCDESGELRFQTKLMPATFSCTKLARAETPSYSTVVTDGRRTFVASFPITVRDRKGHLAVLHDLKFADERVAQASWYWALAVIGIGGGLAGLATLFVSLLLRRWLQTVRQGIREARQGIAAGVGLKGAASTLDPDLRQLFRELRPMGQTVESIQVQWTPRTLQLLLANELPDAEVLVVSNREPYIHNHRGDGTSILQIPASGLVAALEPVMRACGGTWIAHGSGSGDKEMVDAHDRLRVPPDAPAYTLRRIWLTDAEQDGYYYGFANEGLWPLCHIAFVRPNFREEDWRTYQVVNRRFADAVVHEAQRPDPIILVQDYHFALLPQMVRERLPRATILTFWHIPWPNAETFSICPRREEILHGILGSSIIGFHTQFHCNNFLETIDRFVESRIDREHETVTLAGHETLIRPYPISIDWPPRVLETQAPVEECRNRVRARLGLSPDVHVGVGVERFDYTKGVLDRMRAVEELLSRHPEWQGRFVFVQAAAPTRSKLDSYRNLQEETDALSQRINCRFGKDAYRPIHLVARHHEPDEVFELFRAADICVVSSLHDGMNLVAKEFVAARDDEHGVLILSHFAGASRELSEALIVNPYDTVDMAETMHRALTMPAAEQHERMRLMRAQVKQRNVYRWAGQMLLEAARLRRRQRVLDMIEDQHAAS
jgi:trehalose 6-phosphate synthase